MYPEIRPSWVKSNFKVQPSCAFIKEHIQIVIYKLNKAVGIERHRIEIDDVSTAGKWTLLAFDGMILLELLACVIFWIADSFSEYTWLSHIRIITYIQWTWKSTFNRNSMLRPHTNRAYNFHLILNMFTRREEEVGEVVGEILVQLLFIGDGDHARG
jgi:hypothetical protein